MLDVATCTRNWYLVDHCEEEIAIVVEGASPPLSYTYPNEGIRFCLNTVHPLAIMNSRPGVKFRLPVLHLYGYSSEHITCTTPASRAVTAIRKPCGADLCGGSS